MAKYYKIHPAIGVARVGNSTDRCGYFVAPELPGVPPAPPYKLDGKVMRQAARFRIYEYDDAAAIAPVEIRMDSPGVQQIEWTVELANRKAAAEQTPTGSGLRNPLLDPDDISITPPAESLTTPNGQSSLVGQFRGENVPLGEIRTEHNGRLLVLGGAGMSNFVLQGSESGGYANGNRLNFDNNPFWYDDTSDGSVKASITFADRTVQAEQAWVICGPPDFAPGVHNIISLQDFMFDIVVRNFAHRPDLFDNGSFDANYEPSFNRDIYPILSRALAHRFVNRFAFPRHSSLEEFSTIGVPPVGGNDPGGAARRGILSWLRNPDRPNDGGTMPKANDDDVFNRQGLTLTRTQYHLMSQWARGRFTDGWNGQAPGPPTAIDPDGLNKAALDSCTGGSFFPGIETNRVVGLRLDIYQRDGSGRATEIRILPANDTDRRPGFLTAGNALPWQADFLKCSGGANGVVWWPAQRPDDVLRENDPVPQEWADGIRHHRDMVEKWWQLGHVIQQGFTPSGEPRFVEVGRSL